MEGLKKQVDIGGEKVEIDLSNRFTKESFASDPGRSLTIAMEGVRQIALDALSGQKTEAERAEVMAKLTADVETITNEHKKLVDLVRDANHAVPDGAKASDKLDLRGARLSRRIGDFGSTENRAGISGAFRGMSDPFYNLLTQTPRELDIEDKPTVRKLNRFQFLHDSLVLRIAELSKTNPAFLAGGGWRTLQGSEEYVGLVKEIGSAVNTMRLAVSMNETTDAEGKNWVPQNVLSSRILPFVELEYAVANAFEAVPMPSLSYVLPVLGSRVESKKLVENVASAGTTTGGTMTESDGHLQSWTTNKVTFTAKLHGVGVVDTPSWEEDWIGTTDWILRELAFGLARGRENWLINGQLTALLDTAETIGTYDARNMGDGLRYWYNAGKGAGIVADIDASAGLTAELLAKAIGQGGAYAYPASRNVWITSAAGAAQMLVLKTQQGHSVVLTDNEMGAQATFRVGAIGKAFGRDILVSPKVSEEMTAAGLVDTTTPGDRTIMLHVNTDAYKRGERRGVVVDFSSDARFFQHQNAYKATAREDFQNCYSATTEPAVQNIVGIKKF